MPDAVTVSATRSLIDRANKDLLVGIQSDALAAQIVQATLDEAPQVDPAPGDNLNFGSARPADELGYKLARVVSVLLGVSAVPGVNRYLASSPQLARMASHTWAGVEGVVILAAVETVIRYGRGIAYQMQGTRSAMIADVTVRGEWQKVLDGTRRDLREESLLPEGYMGTGQTVKNDARRRGVTRKEQDEFTVPKTAQPITFSPRVGFRRRSSKHVELGDHSGSPLRKQGARIATTLFDGLWMDDKQIGLQTMHIGRDQAVAMTTEPVRRGTANEHQEWSYDYW